MLTWDENKRQANLAKHDIDFAEAETIFDHREVAGLGWQAVMT